MKTEQETLCWFFNKYDSFIIFHQSVKDEEGNIWVSLLYGRLWIGSIKVSVKTVCYFQTILPTGFAHLLTLKNQQYQGQNYCIHQWTHHLKPPWIYSISARSWCWRNSAKFAQNVTHENSCRKWLAVTSLPSLVYIFLRPGKPVWWIDIVCLTLGWVQASKTVQWRRTLSRA